MASLVHGLGRAVCGQSPAWRMAALHVPNSRLTCPSLGWVLPGRSTGLGWEACRRGLMPSAGSRRSCRRGSRRGSGRGVIRLSRRTDSSCRIAAELSRTWAARRTVDCSSVAAHCRRRSAGGRRSPCIWSSESRAWIAPDAGCTAVDGEPATDRALAPSGTVTGGLTAVWGIGDVVATGAQSHGRRDVASKTSKSQSRDVHRAFTFWKRAGVGRWKDCGSSHAPGRVRAQSAWLPWGHLAKHRVKETVCEGIYSEAGDGGRGSGGVRAGRSGGGRGRSRRRVAGAYRGCVDGARRSSMWW